MAPALDFLRRATNGEGRVVSFKDLAPAEQSQAQREGRVFIEPAQRQGWAIVPWGVTLAKEQG